MADNANDYLTIAEACAEFEVTPAQLRSILRKHGLGEFMRASMRKQVLLRRSDLEGLLRPSAPAGKGKGRGVA